MLGGLDWLALEVKYLDRARSFYETFLDMPVLEARDSEVALEAGDSTLVLRTPRDVPRGGLHTHYAMAIPFEEYDRWYDRLDERFDLVEHDFGEATSLYFYDTEGNCVELGQADVQRPGIDHVFEVVLEVEDLDRAETFYERLGFDVVGRGETRSRVRLSTGVLDFELWEPHLGLADARGGVHVDVGIACRDPESAVSSVRDDALRVEAVESGIRLRDEDGHYVTLVAD